MASEQTLEELKAILADALGLGERVERLGPDSGLLGEIPEFDSMAILTVMTLIEERFDVEVADDEVDGETVETLGGLADFVESKLG